MSIQELLWGGLITTPNVVVLTEKSNKCQELVFRIKPETITRLHKILDSQSLKWTGLYKFSNYRTVSLLNNSYGNPESPLFSIEMITENDEKMVIPLSYNDIVIDSIKEIDHQSPILRKWQVPLGFQQAAMRIFWNIKKSKVEFLLVKEKDLFEQLVEESIVDSAKEQDGYLTLKLIHSLKKDHTENKTQKFSFVKTLIRTFEIEEISKLKQLPMAFHKEHGNHNGKIIAILPDAKWNTLRH